MILIQPNTKLQDFTEQDIVEFFKNDPDENVYYDFKEGIDSSDDKLKYQMRKTVVSFANTFGGFLFLGVLDKNKKKIGLDRLIGLKDAKELGKRFTQKYLERE